MNAPEHQLHVRVVPKTIDSSCGDLPDVAVGILAAIDLPCVMDLHSAIAATPTSPPVVWQSLGLPRLRDITHDGTRFVAVGCVQPNREVLAHVATTLGLQQPVLLTDFVPDTSEESWQVGPVVYVQGVLEKPTIDEIVAIRLPVLVVDL